MAFNLLSKPASAYPTITGLENQDYFIVLDVSDTSISTTGRLTKITSGNVQNSFHDTFSSSNIISAKAGTTGNLTAVYVNGPNNDGIGATLTNSGPLAALVIDDVALSINDRVLVFQQSSQLENGVYIVSVVGNIGTPWVLTRAADYNGVFPNQIKQGDFIIVVLGTINQRSLWVQIQAAPIVVGTDAIVFEELNFILTPVELWMTVNSTSQAMIGNTGYIANTATLCTLTLPLTAQVGDIFKVQAKAAGGWRVAQNAGQQIFFGDVNTTLGIGGYLESTGLRDNISLLCTVADTEFTVNTGPVGNITYV